MAPASALSIHRRPRRYLVLAALATAAASGAIPFATAGNPAFQIAGAIWLGLCAHALWGLLKCAMEARPVLTIDARGILDTRLLPRPIEWREIASFYPIDLDRSRVVELRLHDPYLTLAEAPWHVRLGLDWHRPLDLPDVCVSLLLLDGGVIDVVEAIQRYAPHLAPRVDASLQPRTGWRPQARPHSR